MIIINLTQHASTPEQSKQGVVDLTGEDLSLLKDYLTFNTLPSKGEIAAKAQAIATLATLANLAGTGANSAMIGGAPYLMGPLEQALKERGLTPLYAFSERVSKEAIQADGSIKKVLVFRHLGFVQA